MQQTLAAVQKVLCPTQWVRVIQTYPVRDCAPMLSIGQFRESRGMKEIKCCYDANNCKGNAHQVQELYSCDRRNASLVHPHTECVPHVSLFRAVLKPAAGMSLVKGHQSAHIALQRKKQSCVAQ